MKTPYQYVPIISEVYRSARKMLRYIKYRGIRVTCPLCKQKFSSWIAGKENGTCPSCESETRHRLLWLFLEKHSSIFNESHRLLHFAPEKCLQTQLQNLPHLKYTTADLSAPGVDVHTDLTNLNFNDRSFDTIICCHVLEHIPNDRAAMAQIYRVLAPKGVAYIQVPYNSSQETDEDLNITDPVEREQRFGQSDHVRIYGKDLTSRLESVGFQVIEEHYARDLEASDWQRYGLWDDVIFCCIKPDK